MGNHKCIDIRGQLCGLSSLLPGFLDQIQIIRFSQEACLLARPCRWPPHCIWNMNSIKWKESNLWLTLKNNQSVMALCRATQMPSRVILTFCMSTIFPVVSDAATADARLGLEKQNSTVNHILPQGMRFKEIIHLTRKGRTEVSRLKPKLWPVNTNSLPSPLKKITHHYQKGLLNTKPLIGTGAFKSATEQAKIPGD